MPIQIKTGVGRVVWGNPAKAQKKTDQQTKQPILKDGQPVMQWAFGVAFPKAEFQQMVWPAMEQEARSGYPNGCPPKFAWKYQDGDGIDSNGQPFNKREGYAGCFVLTVSSEAFAPPIYKYHNGAYVQLQPDQIKTGDYVVVALNIVVNVPDQKTHTPSLYINPVAIEHVGYGVEIQHTPDPLALFGGQQRQLPPGASATPIAPAPGVGMPGTSPMGGPGPAMQPAGYPQPAPGGYVPPNDPRFTGGGMPGQQPMQPGNGPGQYQQPPMHQPQFQQQPHPGMIQPAHDFVHNAGQQQPNGMPQGQPQYQPQPGQQQPGGYPQPGQMPGMMPPNR